MRGQADREVKRERPSELFRRVGVVRHCRHQIEVNIRSANRAV